MYRYDASYAVEVQRAHPGRFAIVKPVDPDDPAVSTSSRSSEVAISWCGRPPGIITLSPTPNRAFRPPANSRSTQLSLSEIQIRPY
jgi:L-fuconolactonase